MGIRFIKISTLYLVIGVCMGMFMSITHDFTLKGVHVHVNLLGWAAMMSAGIVYYIFPQAGASKLGKTHFWIHNIALPVMMVSLALLSYGNTAIIPLISITGTLMVIAIILFMINIFINAKASEGVQEEGN